jgi:hypothetical protein
MNSCSTAPTAAAGYKFRVAPENNAPFIIKSQQIEAENLPALSGDGAGVITVTLEYQTQLQSRDDANHKRQSCEVKRGKTRTEKPTRPW